MTDTLTAPSWESAVLRTVPSGFLAHDWQPAADGRTFATAPTPSCWT
ncbi:hypothetical protein ABZ214_22880 [Streptomyces iakyrus]